MTFSKLIWRIIALAVVGAFFWLATSIDVYNATSPRSITRVVFGPGFLHFAHPWWLSVHVWMRKVYSIVAFTLVGFAIDRAFGKTARPAFRAALIVGAFSLLIEIAQRLFVGNEPNLESAFDIGCGAFGGWLAVMIAHVLGPKSRAPAVLGISQDR